MKSYSAKWVQELGCYVNDFPTPSSPYPIRNSYLYVACYFLPQDVYYCIFFPSEVSQSNPKLLMSPVASSF